ncbi:GrpB family protein [Streptacidiphilus neutrinimicus]|uniref:GrpB family protein n=1 Tax=Streptacidiphilus neutrinimicus TaxID=105420 RepID=UPI0005A79D13|nr:GrpB family protein [Streptacidiphilus neutrinimicus]
MSSHPVVIADYDPTWPQAFAAEAARIVSVCPTDAAVEHIGSTAVPGLAAKPVLDVLVGVRALEPEGAACVRGLVAAGYRYRPDFEAVMPHRRYLTRDAADGTRIANIHLVRHGDPMWSATLAFRDALRTDPFLRAGYEAAKRSAAATAPNDVHAYNDAKGPFIAEALAVLGMPPASPGPGRR